MEKQYLHCIITTHEGREFFNPLKLSEVNLVNQILKENSKVEITLSVTTKEHYKYLFG